jgi:Flp pilus assembly protein protease CpaA
MDAIIFLLILALIWIIFASIQDLKKREVANWISFSLIIFALGFRFFYSFYSENFNFFYQGLIGLGIFFVIGHLFYYGRILAGGDTKLMIALGSILPFSESFLINIKIFVLFFFIFLFIGGFYGLTISIILSLNNFKKSKKEFSKLFNKNKKKIYLVMFLGLILMAFGFVENIFFILGILSFISPYFYTYARAVDESCMVKKVKTTRLTEGDWLYKNIRVGKKLIRVDWEGLSKKDIKLIQRKYKTVLIRQGIPFVPVFFISFLVLIFLFYSEYFQNLLGVF